VRESEFANVATPASVKLAEKRSHADEISRAAENKALRIRGGALSSLMVRNEKGNPSTRSTHN
jgi:hypothetical protein